MNKFYNNEDDFLRNKLVEHEFDALPQAWEQMSALLDNQPIVAKRSAGYYWWGIPIAALIIGAASSVYYYNNQKVTPIEQTAAATTTVPMALRTNNSSQTSKPATKTLATAPAAPSAPAIANSSVASNKTIITTNNTSAATTSPTAPITASTATKPTKQSAVSTNKQQLATNNSPAPTAQAPISSKPTETNENIERTISLTTTPITTPKILSEEQKSRVMKRRTEIIYQYSTTPLRALQEKREQNLGTFGIQEEVSFKKSPIQFGVVVGASTQLPAISSNKVAFRPVLGAQVSARLAKHHSMQLGAQYKNLAVDTDPTIENTTYTGDQTGNKYSSHQIKGLHLLEFPVVYKVHPHPKYNLQAGVKPAVLLGMDSDAQQQVALKEANTGLSSWDLGVLLGAEYSLNKHWSIGIQYTLGLMNIAQNAKPLHQQQQETNSMSSDPVPTNSINKEQELLVPVGSSQGTSHYLRVPEQIRNSDLQLLLKYNF